MIEVFNNLFVGSEIDVANCDENWAVVHACKEPFHRIFVGYTERAAPKEHPEYFWSERGNELALNIVDAPKPEFFNKSMIDRALEFIDLKLNDGFKVLVHCNQGESRGPSIGMLYLGSKNMIKNDTLEQAEFEYRKLYPSYNPGTGIRGFMELHWGEYLK